MPEVTGGAAAGRDVALEEFLFNARLRERMGSDILPQIRKFFDERPDVWDRMGDLARSATMTLAGLAAGGDSITREAIVRKAGAVEAEFAGPDASPLERLLAASVAVCWLGAAEAEIAAADGAAGPTPKAEYLDRRRDRARKRLESALKTLALVRKLLRPTPAPPGVASRLQDAAPAAPPASPAPRRTR